MSAQDLFQQGVIAIRDEKDMVKGRNLLTQALRLNPSNDMAWLWLSRTVSDQEKKKQCIERALGINPNNEQALRLMERLAGNKTLTTDEVLAVPRDKPKPAVPTPVPTQSPLRRKNVTPAQELQINALLQKAKTLIDQEKTEAAVEQWVRVLEIEPDHEVALANAVRYLSKLKYMDDVKELVWNALDSGTQHPSIYLTAIDIIKREDDLVQQIALRSKVIGLPAASEDIVIQHADYLLKNHHFKEALEGLEKAAENHPQSQKILLRTGNVLEELDRPEDAIPYFERVVKVGIRTPEGKEAEEKLNKFAPALTDSERGSVLLAIREAVGVGLFVLIMGWLDSGLNFLHMNIAHWLGALLGLIGGYVLITATSSPQQKPLATWLGGQIPEPDEPERDEFGNKIIKESTQLPIISPVIRIVLGIVGVLIVGFAISLVFSSTIHLLGNPDLTYKVPTFETFLAQLNSP